jgi:hypothetical protein
VAQNLGDLVNNYGLWLFQGKYVIFTPGVCILSFFFGVGRLPGNIQPMDTPPTFLNTTFDYSSTFNGTLLSTKSKMAIKR